MKAEDNDAAEVEVEVAEWKSRFSVSSCFSFSNPPFRFFDP
jgi:hypothetical protein